MEGCAVYAFLFISCSEVISDWVELPKVTPINKNGENPFYQTSTTLSTPILGVFTKLYETGSSMSPLVETSLSEPLNLKSVSVENSSVSGALDLLVNINISKEAQILQEIKVENISHPFNDSSFEAKPIEVETVNDYEDPSKIIEETFREAKTDMLGEVGRTAAKKLEYLQNLQNKLSFQIRRLSQGMWTERQARGKKLMAFASMEGALMTIAFLTFAVFLIKIVHQFIEGLQNKELTMLVNSPNTSALRRPKREQRQLAAAHLLQHMDEFSIKHKLHCNAFDRPASSRKKGCQ